MSRPCTRIAATLSLAAALLLSGPAAALAAPGSGNNGNSGNAGGNGKSSSAGGNGKSSSGQAGNGAAKNASKPAPAASANPGNPAPGSAAANNSAANNSIAGTTGPKSGGLGTAAGQPTPKTGPQTKTPSRTVPTLPDQASPVAVAATGKTQLAAPQTPAETPSGVTGSSGAEEPTVEQTALEQPTAEQPAVEQTPGETSPGAEAAAQSPSGPDAAGDSTGRASTPPRSPVPLQRPSPPSPAGAESAAISVRQAPATGSRGAVPESVSSVPGGPATADGGWTRRVGDTVSRIAHEVVEALREVSLKDLALAALPGIAGLMFLFVLGVGLGHRQARFAFSLDTGGALRFAVHGPLGVVRSGRQISVRTGRVGGEVRRSANRAA